MARAIAITKALATAASATAVCLSQTPLASGNLTINGIHAAGGVATLDSQRRILVTSGGDDRSITFTITGTNESGTGIKDTFAGSNGSTAQSNLDFLTVTQVYISGASASTITVGTNGVGSCPWQRFDSYVITPDLGLTCVLVSGGTATIQVEYTNDDFMVGTSGSAIAYAPANTPPNTFLHPSLQALTATTAGTFDWPIKGWRFTILSGTSSWTVTGIQQGVSSP